MIKNNICKNCNKNFNFISYRNRNKTFCSKKCNGEFYYKNNKEELKIKLKKYYYLNKNKYIEKANKWKLKNSEKRKNIQKKYNKKKYQKTIKENPNYCSEIYFKYKEKYNQRSKLYKKNNKNFINYLNSKRRAMKIKATPKWINKELIKNFYNKCPIGFHVDHIYPLKSNWVCGLHVIDNLQYLKAKDNLKKNNKKNIKYHKEAFFEPQRF